MIKLKFKCGNNFNRQTIEIFKHQYTNNSVYSKYCKLINVDFNSIKVVEDIPFLPIQFFKNHKVSSHNDHTHLFKSSGTGGGRSIHYVKDIDIYIESFTRGFKANFGSIENTVFYHYNLFTRINWSKYEGFVIQNLSKRIYEQLIPHHFGDP